MISVLYVDDERDLLGLGKIFLERLGDFEVTLLDSAHKALDLLENQQFEAIISDYQMPGMDGLEFLQVVRKRYGQVPFILFTGKGREEVVILALNYGADFYLQKGGDPQSQYMELVHKVEKAVQRREMEKALAESERRYRDVIETQTEFIIRIKPDFTIDFVNEAYCRHLGKSREELLGSRFSPNILSADRDRVSAHFSSLTIKHQAGEIEHRVVMPDGDVRWHWWSNRALFDDSGTLLEYQSVGTDITDRKLAEEALRERDHRLLTLGQSIPGAIFQFELSDSGGFRFPYVQGRWEDLFGVSPEDAMRSSEGILAAIHPDDLEKVNLTIRESSTSLTPWSCEFRTILDGQIKWVLGRSVPEKNPVDHSTFWNGVLMDITDLKRTQEALQESEEKFRVLTDNAPVGITMIQDNLNVYVNDYASMMSGYSKEEYYSHNFWEFVHPEYRELIKERGLARLRGEDVPKRYVIKYLTKDGNARWADISADIIMFQGKPALIAMLADITDRKLAEEELQGANEELTAAHEELQAQLLELQDQQIRLSESEKNYRTILENIQDVYYRTDREGNLILASPSLATVLGYDTVSELYGVNIATSLYLDPEMRKELLAEIERTGFVNNYEVVMKKSDGSAVHVLASSHAYHTANGDLAGVEGIFRDITERKKMEDALRVSENLYRSVFDNTGAGTIIIGPDTTILLANTSWEKLTGIPRQDQENKRSWTEFVAADDLDRMRGYHYARRKDPTSVPKVYECKIIDAALKTHYCVLYVDLIPHSQNTVASLIDITSLKMAESALFESEEKYRLIIERMQDPFYRTDLKGCLLMVNLAFVKQFGYQDPGELIGKNITDVIYLNPVERDELIRRLTTDGEVTEYRLTMRRDYGNAGTFTASSHLIYDSGKNPVGVEGILHDITDHLRIEEALAETEIKYHELSELLPLMVFELDPEFRITYANRYALDSLGYTLQDISDGMQIFAFIDPSEQTGLKRAILNQWQNPDPGIHEYVGVTKDGGTFPILVYTSPVYRDQVIYGYCGVIIDISERKQMYLALQESEKLFRKLFNNASDEIILHEISQEKGPGRLILVNDSTCERLGYSREELMHLSLKDIIPREIDSIVPDITALLFSDKKAVFESAHQRKDSTGYPIEVNAHLFQLGNRFVVLSVSRDISERKRADEALRQANNKLNILSSITRHDLLNQLNALMIFLELSKNQVKDDPGSLVYLEKELEIAEIMYHQIGFTKSYQDIGVEKPEWTDVEGLILRAARHLKIEEDLLAVSVPGLEIYADRLVEKVFYNLLENSLRHGGRVSLISISFRETGRDLVIEYCDDGTGVPEENKELIFTKGFGSNTGWGMFLSREILSITHIVIRETGIPGKGVRFEIAVPDGSWRTVQDNPDEE